jgi:DNA-binding Lrp family transcriptional regulator
MVLKVSTAFVLINTDLGEGNEVFNSLKEIAEVKDVYGVYGVYDYVVRLEADTMQNLKNTITTKIRRINHVRSTLTMIVVE